MNLAVHIGNSSLLAAVNDGNSTGTLRLSVHAPDVENQLALALPSFISHGKVQGCILSSVCPTLTASIANILSPFLEKEPFFAAIDSSFALTYQQYNTAQLGIDRAICCESAAALFGLTKPLIVVDCGTATTLNVVTQKGEYLGGMILPGLQMGLNALGQKTALLPEIELQQSPPFIGSNTKECMLSGAVYGNGLLLDGAIAQTWHRLGESGTVVLTGGNARWLLPHIESPFVHQPNLLLTGLLLLLERKISP